MRMRIEDVRRVASQRPDGYLEEVLASGKVEGDVLVLERVAYVNLLKKYNPTAIKPLVNQSCCGNTNSISFIKPKPKKLEMPPTSIQASNAIKAASRIVANVFQGKPIMATNEVVTSRKAICDACEFLDKTRNRCSKCGCAYARKISLNTERCPIGKWEKETS